jgi:glycosyltransferase involved in cell wall biosynthesis
VWDSVDCISYLFQQAAVQSSGLFARWLTRFELDRTRQFEIWLLSQFKQILITSPIDKSVLISNLPIETIPPSISVLPIGVDSTYFKPNRDIVKESAMLVTSGKMSYHANISMVLHLVQDIMPLIWARRPDVKLYIVGKDPPREISALEKNPAVFVTGTVSDIRPYLRKATLALAPITYGAGIQNKILEAMACATPVVATPQAISALDVIPERDILVSKEATLFAEKVLSMLDDPKRQQEVGKAARHYVKTHHQWAKIVDRLERCYHNAINSK